MIILPYLLPFIDPNSIPRRTFRKPLIVAVEMNDEMEMEGLTQAELAKKHGISGARVHQWLSLLQQHVREKCQRKPCSLFKAINDKAHDEVASRGEVS